MKKYILPVFLCLLTLSCFGQYSGEYEVKNGYLAKDDVDNRIKVYLLDGLDNVTISFTSTASINHQWYQFSEKANDATKIQSQQSGNTSYITDISDGMGYYVGDPTNMSTSYIWIIDYSTKIPMLKSLKTEESDDKCEILKLLIDFDATKKLEYKTPSGRSLDVERNYTLEYSTMVWNKDQGLFMDESVKEEISFPKVEHLISAPLKNTVFTLTGDQFGKHLGIKDEKLEISYEAKAVRAKIISVNNDISFSDNQITGSDSISAPANFTFTAQANEPVAVETSYTWEIYNLDQNPTNPVYQIRRVKELNYSFENAGRYKVSLEVSNSESSCTYSTTIEDIAVSDFMLWVPNAFSPTSSPGVNDIFKVAYKSVIRFNGWIFNRWGNELFHWSDPSQGWDGKYRGKYVSPGTYFYVIEATDSSGKKHIKKGDINILGGR